MMENVKIRKIEEKDIEKTAVVFADAFNYMDQETGWTVKNSTDYINYWKKRKPELIFVADANDEIVGGIMGDVKPLKDEIHLTEIVLFVSPKYHKQGIAKKLVEKITEESITKYNVTHVDAIADSDKKFPMGWYNRIGLEKTSWVYIEGKAKEILKNTED